MNGLPEGPSFDPPRVSASGKPGSPTGNPVAYSSPRRATIKPASSSQPVESPRTDEPPHAVEPDSSDLVCLGCERAPMRDYIVWSNAQGRPIHTAIRAKTGDDLSRVCGGFVVRKDLGWEARLAPGMIVLCIPSRPRSTAHQVRLGTTNGKHNRSWSGTPLCGAKPKARYWLPVEPALASQFHTCPKCRKLLPHHPA